MLHTSLVFSQVSPFMWVNIDYYPCRPRPGFSRFIISTLSSAANAFVGVVSLANRRQDYNQCESILLRKEIPQRQSPSASIALVAAKRIQFERSKPQVVCFSN
ncbi:LOW QUALITY PROTEIN: hypothetical protein PanWU01x14_110820 [Parasponia andersonii]|uniref:Uncharacterized protein n=1 Tax=Parasponia andersonii TaxID=3476 RepID=A0A2P5CYV7_PARAD|nr:LOW QUALITY PROTEIN: hypothetical protein PanWU01x14_110820 [Parasponia andersonii]